VIIRHTSSERLLDIRTVAPIFARPTVTSNDPFQWQPTSKATPSLLHGTHLSPIPHTKVAAFDLDGTLIESSYGGGASKGTASGRGKGKGKADPLAWRWWRPVVPRKLKQLAEEGLVCLPLSLCSLANLQLQVLNHAHLEPGHPTREARRLEEENPAHCVRRTLSPPAFISTSPDVFDSY
jgi:hypothetical protein